MALPPSAARSLSPPPPPPPFLRLPPHIRERIYRYLGVASWDGRRPFMHHLHAGHLKLRIDRAWYNYQLGLLPDPHDFHGLLLACRAIHAETAGLLYSANVFVLYYSEPPDDLSPVTWRRPLHTLHALTAPSLLALTNLTLVLNEAGCHALMLVDYTRSCCLGPGPEWADAARAWCRDKHGRLHQRPLLSTGDHDDGDGLVAASALVEEWHSAAGALSQAAPGRLSLSLVCDIDPHHPQAVDLAKELVHPIRLLPPGHLRECNIRLAKSVDRRLQQLAEDTAAYACGIPLPTLSRNPTAATLARLPRELRTRILEYTDLIAPRREVRWSRRDRAYSVYPFRAGEGASLEAPRLDHHYAEQFFECWCPKTYRGGLPTNGCYCRCRHAAFSAACKCWAAPGPTLFLICRALYEDAQFVFFSGNRFIVHDYEPSTPWKLPIPEQYNGNSLVDPMPTIPYYHAERFAISEFLRGVVPLRALPHIRFLEVMFPPYRPPISWPETDHPAMQDWWFTMDWLKDKANLPALTIRLVVVPTPMTMPLSVYRMITPDEVETVMTAYSDLLQPLAQLAAHGLARFYAHFPSPREWTPEVQWWFPTRPWELLRQTLKKDAESSVMGSRYEDLYANGREEPETSDWKMLYPRSGRFGPP